MRLTRRFSSLFLFVLALAACQPQVTIIITTQTPHPTPTLLPAPDNLDLIEVQQQVAIRINQARATHHKPPLQWDDVLMDYASIRAWEIVRHEIPFDQIDDYVASQIGEPAIELRACLSDNATVPEEIAQSAIDAWLTAPRFIQALSGDWERIGVSLDWGCPIGRGVAFVVILAGSSPMIEG